MFASRAKPASEGLIAVAVASVLTAYDLFESDDHGIIMGAVLVAHVGSKLETYGVPEKITDNFAELVWKAASLSNMSLARNLALGAMLSVKAMQLLTNDGESGYKSFYDEYAHQRVPSYLWYLQNAGSMIAGTEDMIAAQERKWTTGL